jgi:hypothetical protein
LIGIHGGQHHEIMIWVVTDAGYEKHGTHRIFAPEDDNARVIMRDAARDP